MDICVISFSNIIDDIRIAKEIKALLKSGFDVGGIGIGNNADILNFFQLADVKLHLLNNNILASNSESAWSKIKKNMFRVKHCFFAIRKLNELKPKAVHVCNLELLIAVFIVCKVNKIKIVYDSFEIWADMGRIPFHNRIINLIVTSLSKKILMFFERVIVKRIEGFICVSHSMSEYFVSTYEIKPPIVLTNCPYSTDKLKPKSQDFFEVLYHGNYSPGRGIEELVVSAAKLPKNIKIVLRISYFGDEACLRDLIVNYKVHDRVAIENPVPMTEVVIEASRSQVGAVFTLPTNTNHMHTVSNKIFDYVNAGLPVIMSNVKEHVYLNNKYNIGIVVADFTPENIASAIVQLSSDKVLYDKLSSNCFKAAKDLNWEIESKKLIQLYDHLLDH